MIINPEIKKLMPLKDSSHIYVVADFDRTLTTGSSKTSWSILSNSDLVPKSYAEERQALYDIYRPIEIDETLPIEYRMSMMKEWFQKHIELFVKYKMKEEIFEKAATDLRAMDFRPGAKEFITFLYENNIPLIIISAGVGNFIETFLRCNNCYFDNIYVSSNKVLFENGIAIGVDKNIIHSLNKNEVSLPYDVSKKLQNRNTVILLGDQPSDLKMVDKSLHDFVITTCFVADDSHDKIETLSSCFDIVCEENDDYNSLKKVLFSS